MIEKGKYLTRNIIIQNSILMQNILSQSMGRMENKTQQEV
jgi:hypothetical protein